MKEQLKYVQILRGFAAFAIVLYHLNSFTATYFSHSLFHFSYGILGINFFLVLTGFIITYVHFKETQHHSSVKKFLLKRFVRVYPFYWLVLLMIIGLESPEFRDKPSLSSAINPTTFEGLVNVVKNITLFPLPDSSVVVGIAWGLTHAIVFYLLFAICIKVGSDIAKIVFLLWLTVIVLYTFNILPASPMLNAFAGIVNIQTLIGSVTGFLFIKNRFSFRIIVCTFFISLAVVAILILSKSADFNPFLVAITTGILFASLIYGVAMLDIRKLSRRPFKKYASPVLVLMGDAAYSIFLSHIIFIPYLCIAFNKILNVPVIPEFFKNILIVVLLFLTIVAGIATYLLIERPLLNFLRKQFRLRRHKKSWI